MGDEIPVDKKFRILTEINRASHFAWREAALRMNPDTDPGDLVNEMWDITGVQTGEAYARRMDTGGDVPRQFASSIAWSSQCMGEDAHLEEGEKEGEYFVRHRACPWHDWHRRLDLLPEDRPGCDRWFEATIRTINEKLGTKLRFETLEALPEGGDCCLRRIWEDDRE